VLATCIFDHPVFITTLSAFVGGGGGGGGFGVGVSDLEQDNNNSRAEARHSSLFMGHQWIHGDNDNGYRKSIIFTFRNRKYSTDNRKF